MALMDVAHGEQQQHIAINSNIGVATIILVLYLQVGRGIVYNFSRSQWVGRGIVDDFSRSQWVSEVWSEHLE